MLANTHLSCSSGTSVNGFVELPSRGFWNWCYEPEALALFAYHYQISKHDLIELVKKIKKSPL
jgi:peptidyl-dipeptidase Dcp